MITSSDHDEKIRRRSLGDISILDVGTFKVDNYHTKPFLTSGGSVVVKTVYKVVIEDRLGKVWSTEKRYSDFRLLYEQATSQGVAVEYEDDYTFPSKTWLRNGEDVKESRRDNFHQLLQLLWRKGARSLMFSFLIDCEEGSVITAEDDQFSSVNNRVDLALESNNDFNQQQGGISHQQVKGVDDDTIISERKNLNKYYQITMKQIIITSALAITTTAIVSPVMSYIIFLMLSKNNEHFNKEHLNEESLNRLVRTLNEVISSNGDLITLVTSVHRDVQGPSRDYMPVFSSPAVENEKLFSGVILVSRIVFGLCAVRLSFLRHLVSRLSLITILFAVSLLWCIERFLLHPNLSSSTFSIVYCTSCFVSGIQSILVCMAMSVLFKKLSRWPSCGADGRLAKEVEIGDKEENSDTIGNLSLDDIKVVHDLVIEGLTRPSLSVHDLKCVHKHIMKGLRKKK